MEKTIKYTEIESISFDFAKSEVLSALVDKYKLDMQMDKCADHEFEMYAEPEHCELVLHFKQEKS